MKILFKELDTLDGIIRVDFGNGYKNYNVADVKKKGIPIPEDCQDLSKIKIRGKSAVLSNLDVVRRINVEKEVVKAEIPCVFQKEVPTEKKIVYECYEPENGNKIVEHKYVWVKKVGDNAEFYLTEENELTTDLSKLKLANELDNTYGTNYTYEFNADGDLIENGINLVNALITDDDYVVEGDPTEPVKYVHKSEYNITNTETVNELQEFTDTVTSIQEMPTITENGKFYADEGKALKVVDVSALKEFAFYTSLQPKLTVLSSLSAEAEVVTTDVELKPVAFNYKYLADLFGITNGSPIKFFTHELSKEENSYYTITKGQTVCMDVEVKSGKILFSSVGDAGTLLFRKDVVYSNGAEIANN